jgi:hypothetical protein
MSGSGADACPRRIFLFSGHMIDAPGRKVPRFPAQNEAVVTRAIANVLDTLNAGPADLAICGGACGGDLIFAEAALARGVHLDIYIPFDEPTFFAQSVDFAGLNWRARFEAVKANASVHVLPEVQPPPGEGTAHERNNTRMLDAASRFGAGKLELIALWDGQEGDGPGGTSHLVAQVRRIGGRLRWIDPLQPGT